MESWCDLFVTISVNGERPAMDDDLTEFTIVYTIGGTWQVFIHFRRFRSGIE